MEYCSDGSLEEYMHQSGHATLNPNDSMLLRQGIARALVYLHEADIIHRDISPHAIYVDSGHRFVSVHIGDQLTHEKQR